MDRTDCLPMAWRSRQLMSVRRQANAALMNGQRINVDPNASFPVEGNAKNKEYDMAGGWTRDGAIQDQIDASVGDAVKLARSRLPEGQGSNRCEDCDEPIPIARRNAIPGVRLCVSCQTALEKKQRMTAAGINRRGSKDSQLK